MKLSISNIAWGNEYDAEMYAFLKEKRFDGLEIAPTRVFGEKPYEKLDETNSFKQMLYGQYNLCVSSMQSIWFGEKGNIFHKEDVQRLIDYTKKAIIMAESLDCHNLVFGCPKNRNMPDGLSIEDADHFFYQIATFASQHHTIIALEPNPTVYNTNFINTTKEAYDYVTRLNIQGLKLNVDIGTILFNEENITPLCDYIPFINHVHISEPQLAKIRCRKLHSILKELLEKNEYHGYVSIEMKNLSNIDEVKGVVDYVQGVFR